MLYIISIFDNRRQLLSGILINSYFMLCGINHIVLYSDQLFIRAGIPPDSVTYATIGIFATQIFSCMVGVSNFFSKIKSIRNKDL